MINKIKDQLKTLTYVMRLYKNRKGLFFKTFFFYSLVSIFPIVSGLAIKKVFEQLTLDPQNNPVLTTVLIFLGLLMGRIVFVSFNSYFNAKGRFSLSADLRMNLLFGILKKPGAESLNMATGDVLNRAKEDIDQIENFAYGALLNVMTSLILTVAAVIILCSIDVMMTIIVFTPILLMVYIMEHSGRHVSKYRTANRHATGHVSSAIGEIFSNIQAVQVNAAEESVLKHLKELNQKRALNATKDNVFSQILNSLYENLFNIGTGIILLFMAIANKGETFSMGNFVIFTYYMNFISFFIMFAGEAFTRYKQIQVSFEHLDNIHEEIDCETLISFAPFKPHKIVDFEKEENDTKPIALERLALKGVSYTYPNSTNGIQNVSFNIKRDSITVISGRIGSGKSTLLKTIAGLLRADDGHLYWNNQLIEDSGLTMKPPCLSYTPQIPRFFSASMRDNMSLGLQPTEDQEARSIYCSVLSPDIEGLAEGIESPIGTNGVKLSGGQQLRLAVARMLLRDSEVYAFDDISSALDIETDTQMWERILENRKGTYVVVSNQKRILQKADQVVLLKEGQLEGVGTFDELLTSHEEMRLIMEGAV
ncbi:MAG: ABC transporter ATP-binding protein [Clostridiales bacterium]|nr:ABC transporter ATP-binding protein [Clostridiales bacterium]